MRNKKIINRIVSTGVLKCSKFIPNDELYLKIKYWGMLGKKLNLEDPQLFNEKLQWLKLYDRKPEYSVMVDKYAVKNLIADKIGPDYIIPTLGVWDKFEEIDFNSLPDRFVLKCTHDSGGLVVCNDKNKLNLKEAKKKIEGSLKNNYFWSGREWPYKNVRPRIIAEQYMSDNLWDYKALGFPDAPRMMLVYSERFENRTEYEYFYDEVWKPFGIQTIQKGHPIFPLLRQKQYESLKTISALISEQIALKRADYYEIDEKNYFCVLSGGDTRELDSFFSNNLNVDPGNLIRLPGGYRLETKELTLTFVFDENNDGSSKALVDYKFFCFDGYAESVMVSMDRETGDTKFYFFDKEWNLKRYNKRGKEAPEGFTVPKPASMDEMFSIAEKLSKGIPYVRVDLYNIDGLIYFGETTFFPDNGFDANLLPESNKLWGDMLHLPEKTISE